MELEGKPLSFWLQELICDDIERRDLAVPLLSRFDDEFKEAVQATLSEPDFPTIEWLNQLIDFLFWVHDSRMDVYRKEKQRNDRVWEKLQNTNSPEELFTKNPTRVRRWMLSSCDPKNKNERAQEILFNQQMAARWVLAATGEHVLQVPERLCEMLDDKKWRLTAGDLLRKLGPRSASQFAEELWTRWLADYSGDSSLLARVICESPEYIQRVGACLEAPYPLERRRKAADVLVRLGAVVVPLVPQFVPVVREWLDDPSFCDKTIYLLNEWTQGQEPATDYLIEQSFSEDIWIKKSAMVSLGHEARDPKLAVPRLTAAFDDYEEPDSDDTHYSDFTVVTRALGAFGPAAAPAVPALLERIVQKEPEVTIEFELDGSSTETRREIVDRGVVGCLVAIGAAAIPALPILERYADQEALAECMRGEDEDGFYWMEQAIVHLRRLRDQSNT